MLRIISHNLSIEIEIDCKAVFLISKTALFLVERPQAKSRETLRYL